MNTTTPAATPDTPDTTPPLQVTSFFQEVAARMDPNCDWLLAQTCTAAKAALADIAETESHAAPPDPLGYIFTECRSVGTSVAKCQHAIACGCPIELAFLGAIDALPTITYLCDTYPDQIPFEQVFLGAAAYALPTLAYMCDNYPDWIPFEPAFLMAAGHLPTLAYLWDRYPDEIPHYTIGSAAAVSGNLETVQWLAAKNVEWDYETASNAVYSRNQALVEWLCDNGHCTYESSEGACPLAAAANIGSHELLRYLRKAGFGWGERHGACASAAMNGDLPTLILSRELGDCLYKVAPIAARGGHADILDWMVDDQGCMADPGNPQLCTIDGSLYPDAIAYAHRAGDLSMLEWLEARGCRPSPAVCYEVQQPHDHQAQARREKRDPETAAAVAAWFAALQARS